MNRVAATLSAPLLVALAACAQTTASVSPAADSGPPCAGLLSEFREQLNRDVESGKLRRDIFGRASSDTGQAEKACAAGREVQARSILIATKRNYGYQV